MRWLEQGLSSELLERKLSLKIQAWPCVGLSSEVLVLIFKAFELGPVGVVVERL